MKILSILVLMALAFSLVSCKSEKVNSNSLTESKTSNANSSTSLQMLTGSNGLSNIGFSSDGAYEWTSRGDSGSNLTYIDFKSLSKVFLCEELSCNHDNESCKSWFDGSSGRIFLSSDKEKIFCVKGALGDSSPTEKLIQIDKNGSQRNVICELQAGDQFVDTVVEKGDLLYMTVMQADGRKKLCEINTATGNLVELTDLEQSEWVKGTYKDALILQKLTLNGSSSGVFSYSKFDLATEEKNVFYEYAYDASGDLSGGKVAYYNDGFLYVIAPTENQLSDVVKIDIDSGAETKITSKLPYYHVDMTAIAGVFDDKLLVIATDNQNPASIQTHLFAVSCSDGEVKELHHNYLYGQLVMASEIIAETSERFLISGDFVSSPISLYDTDGVPYTSEVLAPTYRFISKSDYWDDIKKYDIITS